MDHTSFNGFLSRVFPIKSKHFRVQTKFFLAIFFRFTISGHTTTKQIIYQISERNINLIALISRGASWTMEGCRNRCRKGVDFRRILLRYNLNLSPFLRYQEMFSATILKWRSSTFYMYSQFSVKPHRVPPTRKKNSLYSLNRKITKRVPVLILKLLHFFAWISFLTTGSHPNDKGTIHISS